MGIEREFFFWRIGEEWIGWRLEKVLEVRQSDVRCQ